MIVDESKLDSKIDEILNLARKIEYITRPIKNAKDFD